MREVGVALMVGGAALLVIGAAMTYGSAIGLGWLGKLPGDIRVERQGLTLYLPITTCILVSLMLTALFFLISRLR